MNLKKWHSEHSFISKVVLKIQQGWKQNIIIMQLALATTLLSIDLYKIIVGLFVFLFCILYAPNFFHHIETKLQAVFQSSTFNFYSHISAKIKKLLAQNWLIVFLWCLWTLLFFIFVKNYEPFYLFIYLFSVVPIIFFYFLSKRKNRRDSVLFYVATLTWVLFIITLIPGLVIKDKPDEITYQREGLAIAKHWEGLEVDAEVFSIALPKGITIWKPEEEYSYPRVLGTRHYLYPLVLSTIYYFATKAENLLEMVILCQIVMLATIVPSCFNIAISFFNSRKTAKVACAFIMLSTMTLVPLFFLKESLNICIFLLSLFVIGEFLTRHNKQRFLYLFILFFLLALLVMTRVHLVFTLCAVLGFSMLAKPFRNIQYFCGVTLLLIMMLFTTSYLGKYYPKPIPIKHIVGNLLKNAGDASNILKKSKDISNIAKYFFDTSSNIVKSEYAFFKNPTPLPLSQKEDFIQEWKQRLKEEPVQAIAIAIGKSFFAPFPSIMLHHKVNFVFEELFQFTTLAYLIFFPFLVLGLISSLRSVRGALFTGIIVIVMGIYIFHFGECSTRQRLTIDPLLFILIAYGREQVFQRNRSSQKTEPPVLAKSS